VIVTVATTYGAVLNAGLKVTVVTRTVEVDVACPHCIDVITPPVPLPVNCKDVPVIAPADVIVALLIVKIIIILFYFFKRKLN
jgi:hypothetical protein